MKTITATEASRHFSDLLDAVERGETITIVRGSHPVADIGPLTTRRRQQLTTDACSPMSGGPVPRVAHTT